MMNELSNPAKAAALVAVTSLLSVTACASPPDAAPEDSRVVAERLCAQPSTWNANVRSIRSFGAVGDGEHDDYGAIVAAADWISEQPAAARAALVFPPGTYKIDRVFSTTSPPSTTCAAGSLCFANHIEWRNLANARVQGCGGARIKLKADFRQAARSWVYESRFSPMMTTITPFLVEGGVGFVIDGFEIDGSARDTDRDPEVQPDLSGGIGIETRGAESYVLSNLVVHDMQSDGIVIGNATRADQEFLLDHVASVQNGRRPLTMLAARHGTFNHLVLDGSGGAAMPAMCR